MTGYHPSTESLPQEERDARDALAAIRYEDAIPQLADVNVPDDLRAEIESRMANYPDRRSAALPCMAAAQKVHGWCSPTALRQVAAVMRVTPAYLVSVASFYDMLETKPRGQHTIYMCTNLSCMLRGSAAVLAELQAAVGTPSGEVSADGIYLREFECLGACDIAPMASVNGTYVGPLTPDDAKQLVEDLRSGKEVLPAKALAKRPMAATHWASGKEPSTSPESHAAPVLDGAPTEGGDGSNAGDVPGRSDPQ